MTSLTLWASPLGLGGRRRQTKAFSSCKHRHIFVHILPNTQSCDYSTASPFLPLCQSWLGTCQPQHPFLPGTDQTPQLSVLHVHQSNQTVFSQFYRWTNQTGQLPVSFTEAPIKPDSYQFYRCTDQTSYLFCRAMHWSDRTVWVISQLYRCTNQTGQFSVSFIDALIKADSYQLVL